MNDRLTNTIFKFLDLYAGDGFFFKGGEVKQCEDYIITPSSHIMTNNGTVIFECLGSGYIITCCDLIDTVSGFFKADSNLCREIIIEWFLNKHNLTVDDVRNMFKNVNIT